MLPMTRYEEIHGYPPSRAFLLSILNIEDCPGIDSVWLSFSGKLINVGVKKTGLRKLRKNKFCFKVSNSNPIGKIYSFSIPKDVAYLFTPAPWIEDNEMWGKKI